MGFSIGSFLGAIAPIVGGIFGGPAGAAIGGAVGAGFASKRQPAGVVGRQVAPATQFQSNLSSIVPVPVSIPRFSGPSFRQARAPGISGGRGTRSLVGGVAQAGVLTQFGRSVGVGGGPVSEILADARAFTGGPVTKNSIIAAAKVCGIDVTSDTFGITDQDVCLVIVAGRTRRRRGISAADIRRTKRTLGFVKRIRGDLKKIRL